MKYKDWLREWLELYEKPSVKPRTYAQYCDVIERRLIPTLGDYDMDELETRVLQRYIVDLSQNGNTRTGKGLAPNSVNAVVLVLHASLTMAYALGLTKAVHVDKIKRPTVREKPVESFTTVEQKLIEQAVLEKNGMRKIRFHDLRHTCASLLLKNGVPMKQIQEWLGHSDFSTTANIYAHLDYNSKLNSADAMISGMSGALNFVS